MPGIVGVTIYDRHRQAIAQAGLTRGNPDTLLVSADIVTEEDELRGTVQLLVEPYAALPALDRFYYTLGGGVGFALVFLLFVARLQRDLLAGDAGPAASATGPTTAAAQAAPAAEIDETPADEDPPPSDALPPVTGPLLRISIVNLANLEARMAPHMLATLIDFYDEVLARAAAIYQGQIRHGLGQDCLIDFPGGGDEEETLFRAMCCAQLFFGVVRETNNARRAASRQTLQFKAALLHDPALDSDTRAALAWEICQHGSPGRLTVNDLVSDHPLLAERMVLDTGNRQLLQMEVPAFGETPASAQDVLVVPVVRLVSPYEELLGRQVSTLCGMAEAGA
jgi:class 3 adenylate cyclase